MQGIAHAPELEEVSGLQSVPLCRHLQEYAEVGSRCACLRQRLGSEFDALVVGHRLPKQDPVVGFAFAAQRTGIDLPDSGDDLPFFQLGWVTEIAVIDQFPFFAFAGSFDRDAGVKGILEGLRWRLK